LNKNIKQFDVMFPVRMSSQMKVEGEAAAHAMGMNFSQFIRQSIKRNVHLTNEVEREVSQRLIREVLEDA
jgi:hypothetical protein